jgi:hypothetical protein
VVCSNQFDASKSPGKPKIYCSPYCRDRLSDTAMKGLLFRSGAGTISVPQTLLDLKRVQVQITRELKELKDAKSSNRD